MRIEQYIHLATEDGIALEPAGDEIRGCIIVFRIEPDDLELIFSMLGEASTTEITRNKNVQGFVLNKIATRQGGVVAGNARKNIGIQKWKEGFYQPKL